MLLGEGKQTHLGRMEMEWDGITVWKILITNYHNFSMHHSFSQQMLTVVFFPENDLLIGKVQIFSNGDNDTGD